MKTKVSLDEPPTEPHLIFEIALILPKGVKINNEERRSIAEVMGDAGARHVESIVAGKESLH